MVYRFSFFDLCCSKQQQSSLMKCVFILSLSHIFSFILSLCSPKRTQRLEEVLCRAEGDDSLPAESNLNLLPTQTLQHSHTILCSMFIILHTMITNYICQNVQPEHTMLITVSLFDKSDSKELRHFHIKLNLKWQIIITFPVL